MNTPERWKTDKTGKDLTSMKVGGPVRYFSQPTTLEDLREDIKLARAEKLPVFCLGAGSNLIISDKGFGGLIIHPSFKQMRVLTPAEEAMYEVYLFDLEHVSPVKPRYAKIKKEGVLELVHQDGSDLESAALVEIGAGVPWGQAVMWALRENLAGLHWYARIPCQVGGAVFNNIHGEKHLLSEVVCAVYALNMETGEEESFGPVELDFGYDYSRFHEQGSVITRVIFALQRMSPDASAEKKLYMDWTSAKAKVQPAGPNCGSVFQNITPEQASEANQTPLAGGWYVEEAGLRGQSEGGMQVYPTHGNFIINTGDATQADFIKLVQRIRTEVKEKFGVTLELEAECIDEQGKRLVW
jgi:UDP-N-acetylmuramate dehydrogenase